MSDKFIPPPQNDQVVAVSELVSLKSLARKLGTRRDDLCAWLRSRGFNPQRRYTKDSGSFCVYSVTKQELAAIRPVWKAALKETDGRRSQRTGLPQAERPRFRRAAAVVSQTAGGFYIVQLIPEYNPCRVKLGWSSTPDIRLRQHQTAAPTAVLRKVWSCFRSWESAAIAAMTAVGCVSLSDEAFDCKSIESLIARGDAFFAMMQKA